MPLKGQPVANATDTRITKHKPNPTQVQWEMPNPLSSDDGKRRVVTLAL